MQVLEPDERAARALELLALLRVYAPPPPEPSTGLSDFERRMQDRANRGR